ncbi:hypothetical protein BC938DRAFT_472732 [Jimgerdemannia flammicorona]|uniref:Uncharacterized protein n=1 Tax=Jimgerdemannia flammicorona TaxID=994334 RepID=A0A433QZV2_9FUNG|nr:hypothetical protein BC938DRAFT_472732 [Jimgerdemannia flammicorona]
MHLSQDALEENFANMEAIVSFISNPAQIIRAGIWSGHRPTSWNDSKGPSMNRSSRSLRANTSDQDGRDRQHCHSHAIYTDDPSAKIQLYFIVPDDIHDDFKLQNYTMPKKPLKNTNARSKALKRIEQWVLKVDLARTMQGAMNHI